MSQVQEQLNNSNDPAVIIWSLQVQKMHQEEEIKRLINELKHHQSKIVELMQENNNLKKQYKD